MRRLSRTEFILAVLLIANLLFSLYLWRQIDVQNRRLQTLERNDAVKQQVQKLDTQYRSLKQRVEGLFK